MDPTGAYDLKEGLELGTWKTQKSGKEIGFKPPRNKNH